MLSSPVKIYGCIFLFFLPLTFLDQASFPFSDGAEHGAAVLRLAQNFITPGDPMLADSHNGSPRYVPSIWLMAVITRVFDLDVLLTLKISGIIGFFLFVCAVTLFAREYFGDKIRGTCTLVSMLFLWGLGWHGANAYMFSAIVYTAYYPSVVAFSLSFLAFFFELRFLNYRSKKALGATLILGGLAFVNHPLTGSFFLVCFSLLLIERNGWNWKTIGLIFLAAVIVLTLSVVWPYYSFFAAFFKISSGGMATAGDYQTTWEYLHSEPLLRTGLALFGLPLIGILVYRRQHLFLTGGFALFASMYILGTLTSTSLTERFILFAVVMLQLTFACFWGTWVTPGPHHRKGGARVLTILIFAGIILQGGVAYEDFIRPAFKRTPGKLLPVYENPNRMQKELRHYFTGESIVMTDVFSAWALPVYTGARITALFHTPPHVADNLERCGDSARFYSPQTTVTERHNILKRYQITHVLLNYVIYPGWRVIEPQMLQLGYSKMVSNERYAVFQRVR